MLVVGNPANTNCLIAMRNAPGIPRANFNAMTRLDHNRALSLLAEKAGTCLNNIRNVAIWGNHSSTMFTDINNTLINNKRALDVVSQEWYETTFIPEVAQRGAAIIKARGASSAASAANAAIFHVRDWILGSNEWVSMSIPSDGTHYNIPKDIIYSFPCTVSNGVAKVVTGLKINEFSRTRMEATANELVSERKEVEHLI